MNVNKWFDNKSIAIIGNSLSLFNKDYGTLIDSHDVVCRLNKGMVQVPLKSHGKKLDVVFASKWNIVKYFYKKYIIKNNMHNDIKFVICSRQGRDDITPSINQEIYYYPLERHKEFKCNILNLSKKQDPSTGIIALDIISHTNPKSVSMFGFDWKKTPTFYDLDREKEPHFYELEKKYCLDYFIKKLGYVYYK
jgi:hypothetical protein